MKYSLIQIKSIFNNFEYTKCMLLMNLINGLFLFKDI